MTRRSGRNHKLSGQDSQSVSKSRDPRTSRTRALLSQAFFELLLRRPYARIRVADIVRRAGVGRATFYVHFPSRSALLLSEIERVVLPMIVVSPESPWLFDCTRLFAHVLQARGIYSSLMTGPSRAIAEPPFRAALEAHISVGFASRNNAGEALQAPGYLVSFVAATILNLLSWAIVAPEAPDAGKVQSIFQKLVAGGLGARP